MRPLRTMKTMSRKMRASLPSEGACAVDCTSALPASEAPGTSPAGVAMPARLLALLLPPASACSGGVPANASDALERARLARRCTLLPECTRGGVLGFARLLAHASRDLRVSRSCSTFTAMKGCMRCWMT